MSKMQRAKSESSINRRGLRRTQSQGGIRRRCDAPKKKRDPVLVRRKILEGGFWTRFARRFIRDEIEVECIGDSSVASSVFYSADTPDATEFFSETQPVFRKPTEDVDNLVYRGDPYEIRVVGMQVARWDTLIPSITGNEIVMFSEEKDQGNSHSILPYIHYDFQRDGTRESTKADEYIPIPSTKSYVAGFKGSHKSKHPIKVKPKKNVDFRFRLLEIDSPDGSVRNAIDGLENVDEVLTGFSSTVPFLGLISPALGMSSVLTARALESFSKPDFIMSVDMSFLIADKRRVKEGTHQAGNYLRYGYYYFLSEPTEAKLYASVKTPQHVQLMLHQDPEYLERMKKKRKKWDPIADREYFPIVETNYIVIRVSEPTGISTGRHKYTFLQDASKLRNIFSNARNERVDPLVTTEQLIMLGGEMGVFDSDDDECNCPKCIEKRYGRKYPWDNPLDPELAPIENAPSKTRKGRRFPTINSPYSETAPLNRAGPSSRPYECTAKSSDETIKCTAPSSDEVIECTANSSEEEIKCTAPPSDGKRPSRNERYYPEMPPLSGASSSRRTNGRVGSIDDSDYLTPTLGTSGSSAATNRSQYGSSVDRPIGSGSGNTTYSSDSELGNGEYASGPLPMRNHKNRTLGMSRLSLDSPVTHPAQTTRRKKSGRNSYRNRRRKNRANEVHEFINKSKTSSSSDAYPTQQVIHKQEDSSSSEEEKIEHETNSYRKDDFVRMRRRARRN